jgi:hypothetical protein
MVTKQNKNKDLVIRLLKGSLKRRDRSKNIYYIVVAKRRSKQTSRLDKLGTVAYRECYSFLKIDIKKLTKYLVDKNVKIAKNVWKVLGYNDYCQNMYKRNKRNYK